MRTIVVLLIALVSSATAWSAGAASSYGPWSGTVQLIGGVPGGDFPGSTVNATYSLGKASGQTTYSATISWTVSGSGTTHGCQDGTAADYTYSGAGTSPGTVAVSWGGGSYTITAASGSSGSFTRTDGCTGNVASTEQTQLGPATRSQAASADDQTSLAAVRQTSSADTWTVYYRLTRTAVATATPTPTVVPTPTATLHKPTHAPLPSLTATPSATLSATPSATSSAPHHRHRAHLPATTGSPAVTPSPTSSAVAPVAEPPAPPSGPRHSGFGNGAESALAANVADFSQIPKNARSLALDAALALFLALMLLFPAELFNGTLMENYDEVRGWFGPFGRLGSRLEHHRLLESRPLRWAGAGIFTALTAGIYALVDPGFTLDARSGRLFVALVIGLLAMTVLANGAALLFVRWRYDVPGQLRLRPGALVMAVVCVVVSRAVHIHPGYVYGVVAGFQFAQELEEAQEGRAVAAWAGWLFALSIGSWLLIEPARRLVEHHEGAFLPLVGEEVTAALTVEGLTILLLALAPIRFLHGERLLRWNRGVWAATYATALFAFFAISVRPEWAGTEATVPLRIWLVLFLAFGSFSVAFWSYFRFRAPRDEVTP